jgi:hypothetical protein
LYEWRGYIHLRWEKLTRVFVLNIDRYRSAASSENCAEKPYDDYGKDYSKEQPGPVSKVSTTKQPKV